MRQIENAGLIDVALVRDTVESIFEYRALWRAKSRQFRPNQVKAWFVTTDS
jgi:hypothetical protein